MPRGLDIGGGGGAPQTAKVDRIDQPNQQSNRLRNFPRIYNRILRNLPLNMASSHKRSEGTEREEGQDEEGVATELDEAGRRRMEDRQARTHIAIPEE